MTPRATPKYSSHQPIAMPRNTSAPANAIVTGHQLQGLNTPWSPAPSAISASGSSSGRASIRRESSSR
jgi:hypothetical protein